MFSISVAVSLMEISKSAASFRLSSSVFSASNTLHIVSSSAWFLPFNRRCTWEISQSTWICYIDNFCGSQLSSSYIHELTVVDSSTVSPVKSLVSTVNGCCGVTFVCLACLLNGLAEVRGGSMTRLTMRRLAATVTEKIGAISSLSWLLRCLRSVISFRHCLSGWCGFDRWLAVLYTRSSSVMNINFNIHF